jgi:hypothetical protein
MMHAKHCALRIREVLLRCLILFLIATPYWAAEIAVVATERQDSADQRLDAAAPAVDANAIVLAPAVHWSASCCLG